MRYSNQVAKCFWLNCLVSGVLFALTVSSGQAAPTAAETPPKNTDTAAPQTAADKPFVSPDGDFSILMPGLVRTKKVPVQNGNEAPAYLGRMGTMNYIVMGANIGDDPKGFDQYVRGFTTSMEKHGMSAGVADASGQGWTGKLCSFTRNGNERVSAVVAKGTGTNVVYTAMIDLPVSSEKSKKFLGSLIIFPDKAIAAHQNDSKAADLGRNVGTIIGALLGLLLAIFLVKRFAPKKKEE